MKSRLQRAMKIMGDLVSPAEAGAAEIPVAGDADLASMSNEDLASAAGVDLSGISNEDLMRSAGLDGGSLNATQGVQTTTKPFADQTLTAVPKNAPEWARSHPELYWKAVDAVKGAEIPGDLAAVLAGAKFGATGGAAAGSVVPGAGTAIGGMTGAIIGSGLAYAAKQYGMDAVKQYLAMQEPYTLAEGIAKAPNRFATGANIEMTGQAVGSAMTPVAVGVKNFLNSGGAKLYESSLKIPPSVPGKMRDAAVETGMEGGFAPSKTGFEKLRGRQDAIRKQVSDEINAAAQSGETVDREAVLKRVDGLRQTYQNAPDATERLAALDDFMEAFRAEWPSQIPVDRAQEMKKFIYQELKNPGLGPGNYGDRKRLPIEEDKQLARGLKEELVNQIPELQKLNAEDASLINLGKVLERAVNRTRNYNIIGLGDLLASGVGTVAGGATGGVAGFLLKRVLEDPVVKARIAFAMRKASKMKIIPESVPKLSAEASATTYTARQKKESEPAPIQWGWGVPAPSTP